MAVSLFIALVMPEPARANAVVGTGTAGSCTEAAFNTALLAGGNITFNCGSSPLTITFTTPKSISGTVTIVGGNTITLSGGSSIRPFTVQAGGSLTLQTLTLTAGTSAGDGGCLYNSGSLSLVDSLVGDCTAGQDGGAVFNAAGGTLSLLRSQVNTSTAARDCGGICDYGASLTMDTSRLDSNTATARNAGGLGCFVAGTRTITSSAMSDNHAGGDGGSIYNSGASLFVDETLVESSTAVAMK